MRRIYFIIILLVSVGFFFFVGVKAGDILPLNEMFNKTENEISEETLVEEQEEEPEEEIEPTEPDLRIVNMVVAGDITAHVPQIEQAHVGDGEYDFNPSFEIIAPYIQAADIAVGDLETSQAGPDVPFWGYTGYSGYPLFNAPQALSEALADAGFDVFTMANNHTLDRGLDGLYKSIDHVRSLGVKTFGAYKDWEERDNPLIIDQNGLKIAFVAYTYSTNGIPVPEGHEYCVNMTVEFEDISPVIADIEAAEAAGADLIAVFPHWGGMYSNEPNPQYLRERAAQMAEAGADLILGGHPHYIQPIEWFFNQNDDGTERATLAVYSLGNFISNQHYPHNPSQYVEYGLLLDIDLTKNMDTGDTWISNADYEITWCHRDWRHRVLPLTPVLNADPDEYNLSQSKVEELRDWQQRNIEVVEKYGHCDDKNIALSIAESMLNKAINQHQ
jgi:poly-gamma-glutamate capsule biosynthesis protein CapA/YwtB (metallophosphatase superfamily)